MRAKEYLKRIRKIDLMIKNRLTERQQWVDMALSITAQSNGERVQSSGRQQKMADAIVEYLDIGGDEGGEIGQLKEERREIIATIEQLNVVEYDLLHRVYVQQLSFQDVADANERSVDWVKKIIIFCIFMKKFFLCSILIVLLICFCV